MEPNVRISFADFYILSDNDPLVKLYGRRKAQDYTRKAYIKAMEKELSHHILVLAQEWLRNVF
jgi:hypothetical protein